MKPATLIGIGDRAVYVQTDAGSVAPIVLETPTVQLDVQRLATAVKQAAAAQPNRPRALTLALPSSWCYLHRVASPTRRPAPRSLAYALEEFLPADVETLATGFVPLAGGEYLGVAVERRRLQELLDALAAPGLSVQRVTLDVLAAAERRAADSVLWCDAAHAALLTRSETRLANVRVIRLADDLPPHVWAERLHQQLQGALAETAREAILLAGCAAPERLQALRERLGLPDSETQPQRSPRGAPLAFDLSESVVQRRRIAGWASVRRTLAAALAGLLLIGVGLFVQRQRLHQQREAVAAWEAQAHRQVFPDQPASAGVALRLASERRRWEGLTNARPAGTPAQADALETLRAAVAALPADLKLDLQELRVEHGGVTLRGRTRGHAQAERLAAALNTVGGLRSAAPHTQREPDGTVQFYLLAEAAPAGGKESVRP